MTRRIGGRIDVDAVERATFALEEDLAAPLETPKHSHTKHQLLYAASGSMTLHTGDERFLLPPGRAAFIPAKTVHSVASSTGIALRTIYFAEGAPLDARAAAVFDVTPLAREMILHAMRWGATSSELPKVREPYFTALAGLVDEWIAASGSRSFSLPRAASEELARALRYIDENLAEATAPLAAKAAAMSVRSLARRFEDELAMPFRTYLQSARILRAMELLAKPRASVSAVAYAVGFQSPSSFATAFVERCGETPSDYRRRAASG